MVKIWQKRRKRSEKIRVDTHRKSMILVWEYVRVVEKEITESSKEKTFLFDVRPFRQCERRNSSHLFIVEERVQVFLVNANRTWVFFLMKVEKKKFEITPRLWERDSTEFVRCFDRSSQIHRRRRRFLLLLRFRLRKLPLNRRRRSSFLVELCRSWKSSSISSESFRSSEFEINVSSCVDRDSFVGRNISRRTNNETVVRACEYFECVAEDSTKSRNSACKIYRRTAVLVETKNILVDWLFRFLSESIELICVSS